MFVPDRAEWFIAYRESGSSQLSISFYSHRTDAKFDRAKYSPVPAGDNICLAHVSELRPLLTNPDNQHLREAVQAITDNKHKLPQHNKYMREVKPGVWVDVYDTVGAFLSGVADPLFLRIRTAVDHAAKKLLAPGQRGHKELKQDLEEARDSITRAIEQLDEWA